MAASTYSPSQSSDSKKRRRQRRLFQEADWARSDGQTFHQCRTAFLRTGAANAASGYAYAEFGTTKLIISVFGPRESKKAMLYSNTGRLNCNVLYTTFSTPIRGQGTDNKEYSSMLLKPWKGLSFLKHSQRLQLMSLHWFWNLVVVIFQ